MSKLPPSDIPPADLIRKTMTKIKGEGFAVLVVVAGPDGNILPEFRRGWDFSCGTGKDPWMGRQVS